jgi:hypothetical protein
LKWAALGHEVQSIAPDQKRLDDVCLRTNMTSYGEGSREIVEQVFWQKGFEDLI